MNPAELARAERMCVAASDALTLVRCFPHARALEARYARAAEEALYAALDALAQAQMTSFLTIAEEVTQSDRRAA